MTAFDTTMAKHIAMKRRYARTNFLRRFMR